jgi:C4-dicarboxylate-specific signal transduction histidine kinase
VSMMGELAASLCHEITQPIASARNNARAAQNFLDMQPPDLSNVREALSCVAGDTDRAGDIIDRIRDHIKKAPPRKEYFDLNEAINEGQCTIPGRASIRRISSACSMHSTPRSPAARGWGCRFAGLLSTPMGAGCGQRRMNLTAPYFSLSCRASPTPHLELLRS